MRTKENEKVEKEESMASVNKGSTVENGGKPETDATGAGERMTAVKDEVSAGGRSQVSGVSGWAQIYPDLSRIEYEISFSTRGLPDRTFKNVYVQINMYEGSSRVTSFWMKNYGDCFVEGNSGLTLKGTITPADLRYPDDMRLIYNSTCYLDIMSDHTMEHILLQKRP